MALAIVLPGAGCGALDRTLDRRALASKARLAAARTYPEDRSAPLPFHDAAELEQRTRPLDAALVRLEGAPPHRLEREGLVQERFEFESAVRLRHPESNRAQFWVYRQGSLGARPVVLWVPGLGMSQAAFRFVDGLMGAALARGADVVFYVPPYHLGRTPAGMDSGDAVLATDFPDHLAVSAQEIADLRTIVGWLRAQGVGTLGAFAGSMGANAVLRIATWEPAFDFATLLIPLVRWDDVVLAAPETAPVRQRLAQAGRSADQVASLYRALDSTLDSPRIEVERVSVIYGTRDLVARLAPLQDWARAWGVTRLAPCDSGHTLMLLCSDMHEAYGRFLDEDLGALAQRSPAAPAVPSR